jgi:hypothetical protein
MRIVREVQASVSPTPSVVDPGAISTDCIAITLVAVSPDVVALTLKSPTGSERFAPN